MNRRFLTESEVAERTKISLGTLRRWRLENRGPHYYKFGSLVRYAEDELVVWLEAQPRGGDDPLRIGPGSQGGSPTTRKVARLG
jgi:excisionase family DNA binding protein